MAADGYRSLLRLAVPRRLAFASVPADFSDWLDYTAVVALLVYSWGEGPIVLAFFALALSLPYVLVGPFIAIAVDKLPLRHVLVVSNLGRGMATAGLIFAPNPVAVLLLVFGRGCIDSAFTPARQGAIQASTPREMLSAANGLHQAINQTSKIVGPALGGALLAVVAAQWVFAFNALLSLAAAGVVWGVNLPRVAMPGGEHPQNRLGEALAAISEYRRNRGLAAALLFSSLAYFGVFLYDALLSLLMADFGFDVTAFGLSVALSGAGGLLGAFWAGTLKSDHPLRIMALAALVSGMPTGVLGALAVGGFAMPFWIFLILVTLMGGSFAFMLVPYRTIVQQQAPPDRIARVYAAGESVTMTVMLSAPFIGSLIAELAGTGAAFILGGTVLVALALMTLIRRRG